METVEENDEVESKLFIIDVEHVFSFVNEKGIWSDVNPRLCYMFHNKKKEFSKDTRIRLSDHAMYWQRERYWN